MNLDRRKVLIASSLGFLGLYAAACAPAPSSPSPSKPAPSLPPPSASAAPTVAGPPDWDGLASRLSGELALPGSGSYPTVKRIQNPRFDSAEPLAVASAASAADVAEVVKFAAAAGVPLALRAGGHSYPGHSSGDVPAAGTAPSVVLDVRRLAEIRLNADSTVTIGAGASLIEVYAAVGRAGRALAAGSCPTVGITGLTLGGGVGVLTRAYGLTSDALKSVELVTAKGEVVIADASENPDLFWACRGGGGQVGVVTSLTFSTVPAPRISTVFLQWDFADAERVLLAWQDWAPAADARLWSTLKLLSGQRHDAPVIQLTVTWTGPSAELDAQLAGLHGASGTLPLVNSVRPDRDYLEVMFAYAGCAGLSAEQCTTAPGGSLAREAFSATSHVPYDRLDAAGVAELVARCVRGHELSGAIETAVSLDALGGAVRDLDAGATGFGHRNAYATVQYTATFDAALDPAPFDAFVRGSRAIMVPFWGDGAYANYADAQLRNADNAYFAGNARRLARIRSAADPDGLFRVPNAG